MRPSLPFVVLFFGLAAFLAGGTINPLFATALPFCLAFSFFQYREDSRKVRQEDVARMEDTIKRYTEGTNETLQKALTELEDLKRRYSEESVTRAYGKTRV